MRLVATLSLLATSIILADEAPASPQVEKVLALDPLKSNVITTAPFASFIY